MLVIECVAELKGQTCMAIGEKRQECWQPVSRVTALRENGEAQSWRRKGGLFGMSSLHIDTEHSMVSSPRFGSH